MISTNWIPKVPQANLQSVCHVRSVPNLCIVYIMCTWISMEIGMICGHSRDGPASQLNNCEQPAQVPEDNIVYGGHALPMFGRSPDSR